MITVVGLLIDSPQEASEFELKREKEREKKMLHRFYRVRVCVRVRMGSGACS